MRLLFEMFCLNSVNSVKDLNCCFLGLAEINLMETQKHRNIRIFNKEPPSTTNMNYLNIFCFLFDLKYIKFKQIRMYN